MFDVLVFDRVTYMLSCKSTEAQQTVTDVEIAAARQYAADNDIDFDAVVQAGSNLAWAFRDAHIKSMVVMGSR